jgi:CRISPR-associated endonuclease/helicase Cas3
MGGEVDAAWVMAPERPWVVVGTQDMLLSRALMRGYGASRYRWPVEFGLLHSDALWVFDEPQLMGVGVETGAQLEGLRQKLGAARACRTVWMSATLEPERLATVDHLAPAAGWSRLGLSEADRGVPGVAQRLGARKALAPLGVAPLGKGWEKAGLKEVTSRVAEVASAEGLTLVIVNRVRRAQALFRALQRAKVAGVTLLHGRMRAPERRRALEALEAPGRRIVLSTQVIEAGVDVSAEVLVTELAPWSSLVQRLGRCNRYGEHAAARAFWIDLEAEEAAPYEAEDLQAARAALAGLTDAGPATLGAVEVARRVVVRPVLRRKDLLELMDTTPDLLGRDLEVDRYVRDSGPPDVTLYWRAWEGGPPPAELPEARRDELCRVPLHEARELIKARADVSPPVVWRWDSLAAAWRSAREGDARPGAVLLLASAAGGYDEALGWVGRAGQEAVAPVPGPGAAEGAEGYGDDRASWLARWVPLEEHLRHVHAALVALLQAVGEPPASDAARALEVAALWHDVGKAHPMFQALLAQSGPPPEAGRLWAKSGGARRGGARPPRPGLRHELASALALLAAPDGPLVGELPAPLRRLAAWLVAAHHGRIRVSLQPLPEEEAPPGGGLYARGVWEGDALPEVAIPHLGLLPSGVLEVGPLAGGADAWEGLALALLHAPDLGPLRLAWWEALLRIADWRASAAEAQAREEEQA